MTEPETKEVKHRRTRFVCISDTHNSFPGAGFKLPPGDVLIHAGDLTNQGSYAELEKTVRWINEADFEVKIVIAGKSSPAFEEFLGVREMLLRYWR